MAKITCPHCGVEFAVARKANAAKQDGTVNPFGHPFPHAKLFNNKLTNNLRVKMSIHFDPHLIGNDDLHNWPRSGRPNYSGVLT